MSEYCGSNQRLDAYQDESIYCQLKNESVDNLLIKAGGWGPLQTKSLFFAMLAVQGVNVYVYNFAYFELLPKLLCTTDGIEYHECGSQIDNLSISDDKYAHQLDMCVDGKLISEEHWKVDYTDKRSLNNWMTEHKLYCEPKFYIGLFGSMLFMGIALQGLLLKLSDYFGRLMLIRVIALIQVVLTLLIYVVKDYHYYYILLLLIGVSFSKTICVLIYANEVSPQQNRMLVNCIVCMSDSSFVVIISSLYFMLGGKDWRHLAITVPISCTLCVVFSFFVYESPKFLHARGKYEELAVFIIESARQNGKNFRIEDNLSLIYSCNSEKIDVNDADIKQWQTEYSVWNDLKQAKILINFITMVCIYSFAIYAYFLMGLYMKYASGDIFFNTLITSICELIAYLCSFVIVKIVGHKFSLTVLSSISIIFGIPLIFDIPVNIASVCLICARFCIQATYPCMHYLSNSGLFNPLFVPFVYMISNIAAKVVTIFAPQVVELNKPIPMLSFLVASFGILVCSRLFKV